MGSPSASESFRSNVATCTFAPAGRYLAIRSVAATGNVLMNWSGSKLAKTPIKFGVPWYSATTVCTPAERVDVVNVATPLTRAAEVDVPSILKTTFPTGTAALGATAAAVNLNV